MNMGMNMNAFATKFQDAVGLGDFNTPVGELVKEATHLPAVDWARNLQVCDFVNSRKDGPQQAVKALKKCMKHEDERVVGLALSLCDATIKNCGSDLHMALGTRDFLEAVEALGDGHKGWEVREQSLSLIQQWGIAFKDSRGLYFADCYNQMKARGASFPQTETEVVPVFSPAPHVDPPAPAPTREQEIEKLERDLITLKEKIVLCQQMLPVSPGIESDELLRDVVGFLEACQPRMVQLIEAGMTGNISEDLLERCLQLNDALLRTLAAERSGQPIAVDDFGDHEDAAGAEAVLSTPNAKVSPAPILSDAADEEDDGVALERRNNTDNNNHLALEEKEQQDQGSDNNKHQEEDLDDLEQFLQQRS